MSDRPFKVLWIGVPVLLEKLDTPLKRVGLILVGIAVFLWVAAAIYWNFDRKPFFYSEQRIKIIKIPAPSNADGFIWREDERGWGLYKVNCVREGRRESWFFPSPPDPCLEKFVPHRQQLYTQWNETVSDFFGAMFNSRRRGYFFVNTFALVCLIAGGLMLSGALERVLWWIRTGNVLPENLESKRRENGPDHVLRARIDLPEGLMDLPPGSRITGVTLPPKD